MVIHQRLQLCRRQKFFAGSPFRPAFAIVARTTGGQWITRAWHQPEAASARHSQIEGLSGGAVLKLAAHHIWPSTYMALPPTCRACATAPKPSPRLVGSLLRAGQVAAAAKGFSVLRRV